MTPALTLYPASSRSKFELSVGPFFEREQGELVKVGALVLARGLLAPRLFWDLLHHVARDAEWLHGTFALATRPTSFGTVKTDGGSLCFGLCSEWVAEPSLTLLIASKSISEIKLLCDVEACLRAAGTRCARDPFPAWASGTAGGRPFRGTEC